MIVDREYKFEFAGTKIIGKYLGMSELNDGTKVKIFKDNSGIKYPIRKGSKAKPI